MFAFERNQRVVNRLIKQAKTLQLGLKGKIGAVSMKFMEITIPFIVTFIAGFTTANLYKQDMSLMMSEKSRPLPIVDKRVELANILQAENKTIGLEIGVKQGGFAKATLSKWTVCEKYYLIDPWVHQTHYKDSANVAQNVQDEFEKRGTELIYLRNFSSAVVVEVPDDSLDFIYVDARHDFQGVSEDLKLYWPKLKKDGILAGHDFVNADEEPKKSGQDWCTFADGTKCENNQAVKAAVELFAEKHGKQIVIPRREHKFPSWYLRK